MGFWYMPELAAWPAMVAGGGMAAADYYVVQNKRIVMNGENVYEAADEKEVAVVDHGGTGTKVVRCVEYPVPATVLLFTVTEGEQGKEVAEVVRRGGGGVLVLELAGGECYYEESTGTWEHVVDVQTDYDTFMVLVSVREDDDGGDDDHIVRIRKLN